LLRLFFVSFLFLSSFLAAERPIALVSVAPHRYFVEKIAGDTVDVEVLVPAGASSHTYEPTPKQMLAATKADVWFRVGEGFEKKIASSLSQYNPQMTMVNMRDGVEMITIDPEEAARHHACCFSDFQDVHIWLSAREAKAQAKTIAEALSKRYPQNSALYQKNVEQFLSELAALDRELSEITAAKQSAYVMVSHPAYAYFARDYGFIQLPIEFEGKDPSPQQLLELMQAAKSHGVTRVFTQPQHSSKGPKLLAQQLDAEVVEIDPFEEDFPQNMRRIAKKFSGE